MSVSFVETLGLVAGIVLPLFNIPLILKICRRKSSQDISLTWVLGVWVCIVCMAPSGFRSEDIVWRTFNYFNVFFFTIVAFVSVKYRNGPNQ